MHYFLTPSGLGRKFELTRSYMDVSLRAYRDLRQAAQLALAEVRQRGYDIVHVDVQGEAADVLRLTCLEQGIRLSKMPGPMPVLQPDGLGFAVKWPDADQSPCQASAQPEIGQPGSGYGRDFFDEIAEKHD
jgi:hypothetical protein